MVLAQRHGKFQGPLCREHGVGMAKAFLSKTLIQGWWGIVSFFMNFYSVAVDVGSLLKARRLPPPSGAAVQP